MSVSEVCCSVTSVKITLTMPGQVTNKLITSVTGNGNGNTITSNYSNSSDVFTCSMIGPNTSLGSVSPALTGSGLAAGNPTLIYTFNVPTSATGYSGLNLKFTNIILSTTTDVISIKVNLYNGIKSISDVTIDSTGTYKLPPNINGGNFVFNIPTPQNLPTGFAGPNLLIDTIVFNNSQSITYGSVCIDNLQIMTSNGPFYFHVNNNADGLLHRDSDGLPIGTIETHQDYLTQSFTFNSPITITSINITATPTLMGTDTTTIAGTMQLQLSTSPQVNVNLPYNYSTSTLANINYGNNGVGNPTNPNKGSIGQVIYFGMQPTPMATTPMATTPMRTTPMATTPMRTTPMATTPMATTPMRTTPMATTPMRTTPMATTPMRTTPMATTPMATTPMATTPQFIPTMAFSSLQCNTLC